jgi:tetratricopeptide (TPR) repeat protein
MKSLKEGRTMMRPVCALIATLTIASALAAPARATAQTSPPMYVNPQYDDPVMNGFPSDPQGAIRATRERIAAGDMAGAIDRLARYVAAHPGEVDPRRFLGDLYFRTGQITRAQYTYEEILRFAPRDKETHNRLGTVYAQENRVDDAIAQFNAALPGTDSVNDLVALHERKGDLAAYEKQTITMARQYPTDPAIQGEVGQVYYALHDANIAEIYFARALDEDAQNLTAINGMGLAELAMHDYGDSTAMFQRCLRIDPTIYQCQLNLGAADLEHEDDVAAKHDLDRALSIAPERAETVIDFGYLADQERDWQGAVADYARAIAMDPFLRESYIDLAIDYEQHKLFPLAQAVLLKGIASVRDDGRLHVLLGDAYQAEGNNTDAMTQWLLGAQGTDPDAVSVATQRVSLQRSAAATSPPVR